MISVLVVDDHAVVRAGLEQLLATAADLELAGSAVDGANAVALAADLQPDVILMDLSMPGVDGIEAIRRIVDARPEACIVALTSFSDEHRISDALAAGARGYLLKHAGPDELLGAIRAAARGGAPLEPKAARVLLENRRPHQIVQALSRREDEVLRLVAIGLANKQIARRLGISERTVKAHLTSVFQRLGVGDRTQAALWATQHLPDIAPR